MTIDELIQKRKSIHSFTDDTLTQTQIEAIIEAGRLAPFAGLAQAGMRDFRHFFVIKRDTEICEKILELVLSARQIDLLDCEAKQLQVQYPAYANIVKNMSQKKPVDIVASPILVIVAEHAGMPAREVSALGYVMENMWLKATDMGIGLKLCSGISDIKDKDALKTLLNLPADQDFAFEGCNLGYAKEPLYKEQLRPVPEKSITYL